MKDTFFRSMTWLHTWTGLLVCWLLLLIFFAGSLSYFRHEISLWSKPELHQEALQDYAAQAVDRQLSQGQAYLTQTAPNADRWIITFPSERRPYLSYGWRDAPEKGQRRGQYTEHIVKQDGQTMLTDVRESKGGNFFYRLHFDLHYLPVGIARWIVGLATMFMLIALISGIVIHKRIFKDFFSFRRAKGSRSWLDAHNISAVMALPYHLIITYTGLITLMFMFMPWGIFTNYDGDIGAFRAELNPARAQVKPSQDKADLVMATKLLPTVNQYSHGAPIKQVSISSPGKANSRISFTLDTQQQVTDTRAQLIFDGVSGTQISTPQVATATYKTYDTLMALHTARFSDWLLRGLFFVCGLLGCAMIATGTLLWAVKIAQKQQKHLKQGHRPSIGLRLVNGLNLSLIAGLPLATAVFFMANRLLPLHLTNRGQWEVNGFFITLAVVTCIACRDGILARQTTQRWRQLLATAALAFISLPVLNGITSGVHLLDNIHQGHWSLVGVDTLFICISLALCFSIRRLPGNSHSKQARPLVSQREVSS